MYYLPCSSSSCSTRYSVTLWTWWYDLTVATVAAGSPVATVDGLVGCIVVSALIAAATTVEGRNVIDVRFSFLAVLLADVVRLCAIVSAISLVLDDTSPGNLPVKRIPYRSEKMWANELNRPIYVVYLVPRSLCLFFLPLPFLYIIMYNSNVFDSTLIYWVWFLRFIFLCLVSKIMKVS